MAVAAPNKLQVVGVSFGLFCFSLFLTAYSSKNPDIARVGYWMFAETLRPAAGAKSSIGSGLESFWSGYVDLRNVRESNVQLEKELDRVRAEVARLKEFQYENDRLRGLLDISAAGEIEGVAARVISYDPSNWNQAIVIDQGSREGIEPGMAVIEPKGVVGQVVATSAHSARVLLLTDHSSSIDSVVQSSRIRGIVEGGGGNLVRLRYVLQGAEVKKGELLVTSGTDGVFPKGLVVGTISQVRPRGEGMFQSIEASPAVDVSRVEQVLVVLSPRGQRELEARSSGPQPPRGMSGDN